MKVTVLKEEKLEKEFEVVILANDLNAQIEARLRVEAADLALPGFRKGKVPVSVLKQRYGKMVLGEVLEKAVTESNQKLFKDKGIRPAVQPQIEVDKDFDMGKDLKYTMKVQIIPPVKVMDVSKIKLTREVAEPSEDDVKKAMERIAKQRKTTESVKTKRATKKGDVVIIDFEGEAGGKKHSGMQGEDYSLELGSGSFIPGFEEQLIGKNIGDDVKVEVTFPENYGMKELAGKDAIFKTKIKELRETKIPEIDDAFAGTLGFDDVEALKKALYAQAEKEYKQVSRQKVKKELLDILDEEHKFEVPQTMVDMEFEQIAQQMHPQHAHGHGHGHDHKASDHLDESEKKELKEIADRRVRLGIVLAEIGNQQKVEISNDELQAAVVKEAQKYQGQEAQVFDYFKNNPQALEQLKAPIFEEKVVDYLLETATVTDKKVSLEGLIKDEEAEAKTTKAKKKASGSAKGAMGGASTTKKTPAKKTPAKKTAAKKAPAKKKTAAKS